MAGGLIFVSRLQPVVCLQHLELGHYRSSDHQSSRLNTGWCIRKRYLVNMPQEARVTIEVGDFRKPVQLLSCVAKALYYGHDRGTADGCFELIGGSLTPQLSRFDVPVYHLRTGR